MDTFNIPQNKAGMVICTAGSAQALISGVIHDLKHGTLCLISPINTNHFISQNDNFRCITILDEFNVFHPIITSMPNAIISLKLRTNPCLQLSEIELSRFIALKTEIDENIAMLDSERHPDAKEIITKMIRLSKQSAMTKAILLFLQNRIKEAKPIDKTETFVYKFIFSLQINYKSQRSVTYYAKEAGLSTGYFTSIIKNRTKRTPSEWISTITITQAKILLQQTQKSIKEIASELNFPEQFSFRKYFKKHVGIPPKTYRQNKHHTQQ